MTTSRINYVRNSSFRSTTAFWAPTVSGSSIEIATDDSKTGESSLRVILADGIGDNGIINSGYKIPVEAGLNYTLSSYVRIDPSKESRTFVSQIIWYESEEADVPLATSENEVVVFGFDDKFTSVFVTGQAPFGLEARPEYPATFAEIKIYQVEAESEGEIPNFYLIDAIMFEQSSYVNNFFESITQDQENASVNAVLRPVPYPNITGMELNSDIVLNNLQFNTVDEDGILWVCTDLNGWWGHPEPEVPDVARGLGDGSYDVRGRYAARTIEFSGVFIPPSKDLVGAARNKLISAIDLVKKSGYLVVDEEPPKSSLVRLVDRPSIVTVNPRGRTEFSFTLRAPDPIKYEWVSGDENGRSFEEITLIEEEGVVESLGANVVNAGNAPVPVLLEVHGPIEAGTSIANLSNQSFITITTPLRSPISTASTVTHFSRVDGLSTAFFASATPFVIGDKLDIVNSTNDSSSFNATDFEVQEVLNDNTPGLEQYYIKYLNAGSDYVKTSATGTSPQARLNTEDILEIDTYRQEVFFNGSSNGYRFYIETLSDWIYLESGVNSMSLLPPEDATESDGYFIVYYRSGWIG